MYTFGDQRKRTYTEEVVEVAPVLIVIEVTAVFADPTTFAITCWFENVSWLKENLAGVLIDLFEPVPQLLVPVRVLI